VGSVVIFCLQPANVRSQCGARHRRERRARGGLVRAFAALRLLDDPLKLVLSLDTIRASL
jgi:hypothetical protein